MGGHGEGKAINCFIYGLFMLLARPSPIGCFHFLSFDASGHKRTLVSFQRAGAHSHTGVAL